MGTDKKIMFEIDYYTDIHNILKKDFKFFPLQDSVIVKWNLIFSNVFQKKCFHENTLLKEGNLCFTKGFHQI